MNRPPLWLRLRFIRRWILTAYGLFGVILTGGWFVLQYHVTHGLNASGLAFLVGFGLLMSLVVMGQVATAVAIEETIIAREHNLYDRIQRDRTDRLAEMRDEVLRDVRVQILAERWIGDNDPKGETIDDD